MTFWTQSKKREQFHYLYCTCCRGSRDVIFSPVIRALCKTLSGTGVNLVYTKTKDTYAFVPFVEHAVK